MQHIAVVTTLIRKQVWLHYVVFGDNFTCMGTWFTQGIQARFDKFIKVQTLFAWDEDLDDNVQEISTQHIRP